LQLRRQALDGALLTFQPFFERLDFVGASRTRRCARTLALSDAQDDALQTLNPLFERLGCVDFCSDHRCGGHKQRAGSQVR
jgi:hypothetical protein